MMIVWRMRGKIIITVLYCIVYHSCTRWCAHLHEQFLQTTASLGSGSFFGVFYIFFLTRAGLFVLWLVFVLRVYFASFEHFLSLSSLVVIRVKLNVISDMICYVSTQVGR